jgi:hypothetical protein
MAGDPQINEPFLLGRTWSGYFQAVPIEGELDAARTLAIRP